MPAEVSLLPFLSNFIVFITTLLYLLFKKIFITQVLDDLIRHDARIILSYADWETTRAILCAGAQRGLTSEKGYVWLVLAPRWPRNIKCKIHYMVVTYSYGGESLPISDTAFPTKLHSKLRDVLQKLINTSYVDHWPSAGMQLTEAISAMAHGLQYVLENYSEWEYLHTQEAYR